LKQAAAALPPILAQRHSHHQPVELQFLAISRVEREFMALADIVLKHAMVPASAQLKAQTQL
jgi:hypothetical protein